ncbi:phage tail sheath family protein [Sphaerisporangium corydalis]|uniref:Phage tail sheath family protein n=1 Tax=Sphaerisporangium corydalis TaxID=1441875 RepID=A0ABV9E610_9ACTN|nr:phage tail sheath subtilisin-like domain-containing protein [Sphaerisporangium corydalis]
MPQYFTPGVYVEEVPSAIKPIAGVGTSTAGFIGAVANDVQMPLIPGRTGLKAGGKTAEPADFYPLAPAGVPQLVDGWERFKTLFGDGVKPGNRTLAQAVYGFFNNGGGRCWVTRLEPGSGDGKQGAKGPADLLPADETVTGALDAFAVIDEIALVAVPGATSDAVQSALLDHCENEYLRDRFAILDGRRTATPITAEIRGGVRDSSYGAIYYPWIDVGAKDAAGGTLYVPPSGHIAGVYARVDAERGVHKAPANEVIRGALGVETPVGKQAQAGLNPDDINVIRRFDANVTIWGARTLAGADHSEWRYISSRRLFNYLRESIDQGTQWVVFEPNAPELWSKIRRNVSAFLTTVWASGALLGATPEQAFYVVCDETTNPREVRDLGQVVTEVGVALVKPAEFVVFRLSQWDGAAR